MKRIGLVVEGTYKEGYYAERAVDIPTMETYLQHYPQGVKAGEIKRKLADEVEVKKLQAAAAEKAEKSRVGSLLAAATPELVSIPGKSFKMSKYEATFAQYDAYAEAAGISKPKDEGWGRGNRPVINVNWNEAVAYAKWLSEKTGKHFRLPTEQEWEYAARAGTTTDYPWGNSIGSNNANCDGCGSQWDNKKTAPVGSFRANQFGLYDMHGNVEEWTSSCYESDCRFRVLRGGSWYSKPAWARSAYRSWVGPADRLSSSGFRIAQD